MRRLTLLVLLALALIGCQTVTPTVTGTLRTPDVIYSNPGQK
jgi:uncharacterized protein YcfL